MSQKLFDLYQRPSDPAPLYYACTLNTARSITTDHDYNRLQVLEVGERCNAFGGYIWQRTR